MNDLEIELVWKSDLAVAVNKPAGLSTQSPVGNESLESRLIDQLDRHDRYLAFPHRLDRVVSGVILVALSKKAAKLLSAQFASRKTAKQYLAVVHGQCEADHVQWDDYVRKMVDRPQAEVCGESDDGAKLASTVVRTIEIDSQANQSRLELNPITGRMHQLRLQTSRRGYPILGDELYGATNGHTAVGTAGPPGIPSGKRIMLHAFRLGFHDPATGRRVQVEAPCPF